jgi:hypothetical protein
MTKHQSKPVVMKAMALYGAACLGKAYAALRHTHPNLMARLVDKPMLRAIMNPAPTPMTYYDPITGRAHLMP